MANADLEKYYKALDRYFLFFQFCLLFGLYFCLFGFIVFVSVGSSVYYIMASILFDLLAVLFLP